MMIVMNIDDFEKWLRTSRIGERVAYHIGLDLFQDKIRMIRFQSADAAWKAAVEGKVTLIQQRVPGDTRGVFSYIAVRVSEKVGNIVAPALRAG